MTNMWQSEAVNRSASPGAYPMYPYAILFTRMSILIGNIRNSS